MSSSELFSLESTQARQAKRFEPNMGAQSHLFDVGADWLPGQQELFPEVDALPGDQTLEEISTKPKGFTVTWEGVTQWLDGTAEEIGPDYWLLRQDADAALVLTPPELADRGPFTFATLQRIHHGVSDNWDIVRHCGVGRFVIEWRNVQRLSLWVASHFAVGARVRIDTSPIVWIVSDYHRRGVVGLTSAETGAKLCFDDSIMCRPA